MMAFLAFLERQASPRLILCIISFLLTENHLGWLMYLTISMEQGLWAGCPSPLGSGYHWLVLNLVYHKNLCSPYKFCSSIIFFYLISVAHCFVLTFGT